MNCGREPTEITGSRAPQLDKVLDEFPVTNLPFQIRKLEPPFDPANPNVAPGTYNSQLERNYIFTGVAYWKKMREFAPCVFNMPMASDAVAYAEVHVFIPKRRLVWQWNIPGGNGISTYFGPVTENTSPPGVPYWSVNRQYDYYFATDWSLLSQNWACQLAPATQRSLNAVLQSVPQTAEFEGVNAPALGNLDSVEIEKISPH